MGGIGICCGKTPPVRLLSHMMSKEKPKKIFVGMSGGVDSSVAAALLKKDGYDVTGVFIKVWQADFLPCHWREERRDAMRAAAAIGIPFLTLNLEQEYKKDVLDYLIREYRAGRVPNPDVMCNKHVKFGAFLDFARAHGAEYIATGHYAQIHPSPLSRREAVGRQYHLYAGADTEKDQSYFLWTLSQQQLTRTLFPIGHLKKSTVRAVAKRYGLPNAEKPDSQGLCFLGKINMAEFLKHYLKTEPGDVLDLAGKIIGRHDGALLYTIGQRHGFTTEKSGPAESPYYVLAKDLARNTITVGHARSDAGRRSTCDLIEVNDISGVLAAKNYNTDDGGWGYRARIRHRGALYPIQKLILNEHTVTLQFTHPVEGIASGQSVVLYRGDQCLGGGVVV